MRAKRNRSKKQNEARNRTRRRASKNKAKESEARGVKQVVVVGSWRESEQVKAQRAGGWVEPVGRKKLGKGWEGSQGGLHAGRPTDRGGVHRRQGTLAREGGWEELSSAVEKVVCEALETV